MSKPVETQSISGHRAYQNCNRLYYYGYVLRIRPVRSGPAATFGHVGHECLAAWWDEPDVERRLDAALGMLREVKQQMALKGEEITALDMARHTELLRGYHYRWVSEPLETAAVEQEFLAPVLDEYLIGQRDDVRMGGKVDAIAFSNDGVVIIEHKYSSENTSPGSLYWKRLSLDSQISVYFDGCESLGYEPVGCIYDVIHKPTLAMGEVAETDENGLRVIVDADGNRVRTANGKRWRESADAKKGYAAKKRMETVDEYAARLREDIATKPERYFQRAVVSRLSADRDAARLDTAQIAAQIETSRQHNRWPRNPDYCARYGLCAYFGVCEGTASLKDASHFREAKESHLECVREDLEGEGEENGN